MVLFGVIAIFLGILWFLQGQELFRCVLSYVLLIVIIFKYISVKHLEWCFLRYSIHFTFTVSIK